jgi:glucosylceramidase
MTRISRRAFLEQATAIAATIACAKSFPAQGQIPTVPGRPRAWMTADGSRLKEIAIPDWQTSSIGTVATVEVHSTRSYQSILGFGGAFTDASCYLLSRMEGAARARLLGELFASDGLGLSVGRICIGSSDYSRNAYSYDDSPTSDPELQNFSIEHDRGYILPVLQEALHTNPDLFLVSTPWSPPAWMKTGGSLLGGSMRKEYFQSYAQYFVKFLEAYRSEGVRVGAVTCQNEVDTDQDGRMPACLWGQEYEIAFIRDFLGPALRDASPDTKIWLLDHNYDLWGRVMDELSEPGVSQFVEGVAWHGYAGTPDAMTRVHDAFPQKSAYWTEGGPSLSDPDYATGWAKWSADCAVILKNWARCIVAWNLVLDEKGKPNIGPFDCAGLVTLNTETGELTRSGMYWALAHYAKAARRGAHVIASQADAPGVEHVAFANPDGAYALVLTNQGDDRDFDCEFESKRIRLRLPRGSVLTLKWS